MLHPSLAAPPPSPDDDLPRPLARPFALPIDEFDDDAEGTARRPRAVAPARRVPAPSPVQPSPVLRSKVQPPPLRTSTLSRQRLLDRLASASQSRVTLLVADAGYGKSTLLADFSRRFDGVCLWYSLEPDDLDWLTLVPHLVAAGRELKPEFGRITTSLLRAEPGMAPPKSAVISGLLSELESFHDGRVVIIFDDVHAIEESADANDLLERLMRQAPPSFSFIFAGRRRPALPLARWSGKGELVELTTNDLRFSREETARLFADSYGQTLEADVLDELDARTQGWAACLQLFSTLINGLSPVAIRAAARSLSGSAGPVFDYLAQEVVAKLSPQLQAFLTRASLLQVITPDYLHALFADESAAVVQEWAAEADALGLLSRANPTSGSRQFHPLLREYLLAELRRRHSVEEIRGYHAAVAHAAEADPLTACHHYIEAAMPDEAMRCLSSSTLQTLGSGRSGTAVRLAERLGDQPLTGAVAVMRARRLLEQGELSDAAAVLGSIAIDEQVPSVRAALRQTGINLGWRSGDGEGLLATVDRILEDVETPPLLREIAQIFRDGSDLGDRQTPRSMLSQRLKRMAASQEAAGYDYYAAISFHNAAIASLWAGRLTEALDLGHRALGKHAELAIRPPEYYSTLAVLAHVCYELGRSTEAEQHMREALASGEEDADVPAELAYLMAVVGDRGRALTLLEAADAVEREGRSDFSARAAAVVARGFLRLPGDPHGVLADLNLAPGSFPLDFEADELAVLRALAHLLAGDLARASKTAQIGRRSARERGSRLCEVRLGVIEALARESADDIRLAIREAAEVSELALLELADATAAKLNILSPLPEEIEASVSRWPEKWLPILRRQLTLGDDPRARTSALLLDRHGSAQDVAVLRAFEKTYRRRAPVAGLGRGLARRVSPRLEIHDLGQVNFSVEKRVVKLSRIRRRSAAVLAYLITRPNFTATREQIIEDIWPDGDASGGANSLNQSLYFLRREIDPWYEDDISPEYITFESELVWLDDNLVRVDSVEFLRRSRELMAARMSAGDAIDLVEVYRGQFAPEFEYEEWALGWRSRVHAAYLDFSRHAMGHLSNAGELRAACDVALRTLAVDPFAEDIERSLIWLYWRSGATSAAEAQYGHWAGRQRADGLDAISLRELVSQANPP